jgi:hypothetical protein
MDITLFAACALGRATTFFFEWPKNLPLCVTAHWQSGFELTCRFSSLNYAYPGTGYFV